MQLPTIIWLILLALVIFVFLFVWQKYSAWAKQRRREELVNLRSFHSRLSVLLSELLAKANELDQHRLYVVANPDPQFSNKIAASCQDLVILSESLPMIEHLLDAGHLTTGRRDLMAALHSATKVNQHLEGMQTQLKALSDAQMSANQSVTPKKAKKRASDS
jgi:hypothetical protein